MSEIIKAAMHELLEKDLLFHAGYPFCCVTNGIKALKGKFEHTSVKDAFITIMDTTTTTVSATTTTVD